MRKKFASLVLLSVFTAGVAASGTVSATGGVDDVSAQVSDNVGLGGDIVDSDNSNKKHGSAENLDNNEGTANETKDLKDEEKTEEKDNNLEEQNGENKDLVYTSKEKGPDSMEIAAGVGGTTIGVAGIAYGAKKLFDSKNKGKSKIDDDPTNTGTDSIPSQNEGVKKDEPGSGEEKSEENSGSGFAAWYKNNLGLSIPLTIISAYIIWIIVRMIWLEIIERKASKEKKLDYIAINYCIRIKPVGGLVSDINVDSGLHPYFSANKENNKIVGLKRIGINCLVAATFARIEDWEP